MMLLTSPKIKFIKYQSLLIASLLVLHTLNSNGQGNKVDSSKMTTIRIDLKNAKGGKVSKVFEDIQYIPLQTTKESLFGTISKILIADQHYVIYDDDTHSILVFDLKGKFKSKIEAAKLKLDGGEFDYGMRGFNIKSQPERSLIRILAGKHFFYYDFTGKIVQKILVEDDIYDWGLRFPDGTAIDEAMRGQDKVEYDLMLTKNDKQVAAFFPYSSERHKDNYFHSTVDIFTNSGIPNELFFTNWYDYNIYTVTPNNLYLTYRMLLPSENSLPTDFKTNPVYFGKRKEYFKEHQSKISELKNVFKIGDNLFFKTYTMNSREMRNSLIHNLKNGMLTSIKDLEPDETSMFLPVTDMGEFNDFDRSGFQLFDGTYLYTTISSLAMFSFKEQSAGKNPKYTPTLENYFKTQDRKSNPVLVKLKPKRTS
ncbi:6-bladed beta-propeller [Pedobacter sp. JCM 36344]|uniref:6-bladed beta-propeller n=1 Tax=Pedobacter sp. JCM 36344 TaxID=3374280 RepID=UPI00397E6EC8